VVRSCATASSSTDAGSSVQHVVEVDGVVEEHLDGPALGGGQRLHRRQPVDENAVARVGGDAPRAGVRLGYQPFLLKRGHVVADCCRRDAEVVPIRQCLTADGLAGGDEILDDGPQHLELAFVDVHCSLSVRHYSLRFPQRLRPPRDTLPRGHLA